VTKTISPKKRLYLKCTKKRWAWAKTDRMLATV
jgi:hypothetical protein